MGFKSLSQRRIAGESAIASSIGVYASASGGFNISGQCLGYSTVITKTSPTPGSTCAAITTTVGSTNAVIQSVVAANITYASIGGSIFPSSYIKVLGSGFVPTGYLTLNGTTINGNVYYTANELRANLAATPGLQGSVSNINLIYQLPAINAGIKSISVTPLVVATGGTVYTCGPYKYHVFNSSANLVVTSGGGITVMMVGGGGGGGCSGGQGGAGGGGSGGVIYTPALCVTTQPYVITVGAGGNRKGANTTAFCMTALGGGAGISEYGWLANMGNGGSGGGAAKACGCLRSKGTSYQNNYAPPGALVYGNDGGALVSNPTAGAGGGGAGAVGGNAAGSGACAGGQGGDGIGTYSTFLLAANSGINVGGTYYIAGGGGGGNGICTNGNRIRGGYGGGGAGGANFNPSAAHSGIGFAGNVNTGGGGGGAAKDPSSNYNPGVAGGSGVVIVRYQYQ